MNKLFLRVAYIMKFHRFVILMCRKGPKRSYFQSICFGFTINQVDKHSDSRPKIFLVEDDIETCLREG